MLRPLPNHGKQQLMMMSIDRKIYLEVGPRPMYVISSARSYGCSAPIQSVELSFIISLHVFCNWFFYITLWGTQLT